MPETLIQVCLIVTLSVAPAAVIVPIARRFALTRGLLDVPNERSSHKIPTPRTGGVGIVLGALIGLAAGVLIEGETPGCPRLGFLGALVVGALVGFLDDVFHLNTAVRMLLYLVCAAGLALCGAACSTIALPGFPALHLGMAVGFVFSALFVAWYANLFNFMDGIDGIAGGAAAVTLGALGAVFLSNGEPFFGALALASAAASVGFLMHNYPPASVFMGDGGAVFLGLEAGGLSLVAVERGILELPAALLLMFPFVFDASFTLVRRVLRREKFWAAHRTHVYQQMCDLGLSHRGVTIIYTVAAVLFAALGLAYGDLPAAGKLLVFWGSLLLALALSLFVVKKNRRTARPAPGR